jgi:DNA-directed RNA polymerase subunit H (RpoH/RPB5)
MEHDLAAQRGTSAVRVDFKSVVQIEDYCRKGHVVIINNMKKTIFADIDKQFHSQIFSDDEMMYCPLDHVKVPPHFKAAPEDIPKVKHKFPVLRSYDIVCRWMNFKPGEIVAIKRDDGIYYRIVF